MNEIEKHAHRKFMETSIVTFVVFILNHISCNLLLRLYYFFRKEFQNSQKNPSKTEIDNPELITIVV